MPFLRFHAVEQKRLERVGEQLVSEIVKTLGCPRETVVLEVMNSSFVSGADKIQPYAFVEVLYFERPPEQQDKIAQILYDCLREAGYADSDVYFSCLQKCNYYENGVRL
ncbi:MULTISPECIES: DUF1904 family protein [Porphyromonadaceae]|uniref:Uncharacterized protein n=1 Tax=Sanguibacteroides justesenii TaxID=1547597 RepID=A0A0C3MGK8_9PORP|nr:MULTISPECIES: DUF1904 family protein [Porphyromonadaceae]KIO43449.1 hypothetical protein IE90_09920 [Sanguibacteroides justesenii]KIO45628.1 hypothetical protein BA92_03950 [Sanguibacteroides justesenii]PXZ45279.1 DUF1904 family protein [Sanguibacteroides justesenii]